MTPQKAFEIGFFMILLVGVLWASWLFYRYSQLQNRTLPTIIETQIDQNPLSL